jgi:acetylornithine deacetylase/succinyl-diaminopimelate desuccinylase-like protein
MGMEQTPHVDPVVAEQIHNVIDCIDGQEVVDELLAVATIGGERLEPTADHPRDHIATNRLALTPADIEARQAFIKPRMSEAGMRVLDDHPMAVIGLYPGRYEELEPVIALSHTDTVPGGDIYDGTLGVLGALKAVQIMHAQNLYPERDIMVVSLTLEESSRFGSALRGSQALFHGLTESELDLRRDNDQSIREALGEKGVKRAREPEFGPNGSMLPTPYAVVELHVEQDRKLIDGNLDLGVVHSIATPVRYRAKTGERPLSLDHEAYAHERYFRLTVHGKQDHSGATPMGVVHRADGLLETAQILTELFEKQDKEKVLAVSGIEVAQAAMNKVPGVTTTTLRLAADSQQAVEEAQRQLTTTLEQREAYHADSPSPFPAEPFELERIEKAEAGLFFASTEMRARQRAALRLITSVNRAAIQRTHDNVVGTVASFATSREGVITLEVDIRGIELTSRDKTVEYVRQDLARVRLGNIALGEPLAGSGDAPVELDSRLVALGLDTIDYFKIGSVKPMFSAAGHDTQNAARAGIPSVMIFCQSKDGIAHNPNAFTSPANIQRGVQAQAALLLRLANEVPDTF